MLTSSTQVQAQTPVTLEAAPNFPEQVYNASNGIETGIATIGFRSGRYLPDEARCRLKKRLDLAEEDVNVGQASRKYNRDLMAEVETKSKEDFALTTEQMRQRLSDLHTWKGELESEILVVIRKNELLVQKKCELEKSLMALDQCVFLTTDCLNARQRRFGEDLQQDEVELQLLRELDIQNKAISLIKRAIGQIDDQLGRNREVKAIMESAWSDKHEADMLDSEGAHLTPTCTNKQHYPGEARSWPQAAQSTVSSWVQHTCDLLQRAQAEEKATDKLLQLCTNILHDVERDVMHQKNTVDAAFQRRIDEYETEKINLSEKLKKVCNEIPQMEASIKELEQAIVAKDAYVQVNQTRLHLHNQRRAVENCRDPAQAAMLTEMHNIQMTIDRLQNQLSVSENNLKHLQDEQLVLEKQIHMKNTSIEVDKYSCARHRMHFPGSERLLGH